MRAPVRAKSTTLEAVPDGALRLDVTGEPDGEWPRDLSLAWVKSVSPGGDLESQAELAIRQYAFAIGFDAGIGHTDLIWWEGERFVRIYRDQLTIGARWRDPYGSDWTITDDCATDKDLSQLPQVRLVREVSEQTMVLPIWEIKSRWTPLADVPVTG